MELVGKVWKEGKFWIIEVPAIDVSTQGHTKKEALSMIHDAINELLSFYFKAHEINDVTLEVFEKGKNVISIKASNNNILSSFSLIRQRELSQSTVREVSQRLGSKSPNSYAQYERGKMNMTIDQYERLLEAVNPSGHPSLMVG